MESSAGSVLTLIGGIITLILGAAVMILVIILGGLIGLSDKIGTKIPSGVMLGIFVFAFVLLLAGGILKIYASRLMLNKKTVFKGGIMAIILGVIVSDIFSLIGGIVAVVQAGR